MFSRLLGKCVTPLSLPEHSDSTHSGEKCPWVSSSCLSEHLDLQGLTHAAKLLSSPRLGLYLYTWGSFGAQVRCTRTCIVHSHVPHAKVHNVWSHQNARWCARLCGASSPWKVLKSVVCTCGRLYATQIFIRRQFPNEFVNSYACQPRTVRLQSATVNGWWVHSIRIYLTSAFFFKFETWAIYCERMSWLRISS